MPDTRRDGFDKVRKAAARIPLVTEGTSWGAPALKIRGKMFCCRPTHRSAEPNSLVVRLQFMDRDFLLGSRPDVYYVKPHYVNYPCILVRLPRIRAKELRELLEISGEYVGGKRRT
jgi:hypothetical protein